MSALKLQVSKVNETEIISNVLYECGFIQMSDKNVFIKQLESGEYIRVAHIDMKSITTLIQIFGGNSFDQLASREHKEASAQIANRLMNKYNDISV